MRVLLATSQVTYVPENYAAPLQALLRDTPASLAGVVLLQNMSVEILKSSAKLAASGCRGLASTLLRNILELPLQKREKMCRSAGVPLLRAKSMNDDGMLQWVRSNQIDLIVNLRTRCIYRSPILSAARLGCINIHHGLLPEYRGTFCDLYAMAEGREVGFTIHQMNEKIDAGKILVRRVVCQSGKKNYVDYLAEAARVEGQELVALLQTIEREGKLPEGSANQCGSQGKKPVYTRNPDWAKIQAFRKSGLRL